MSKEKNGNLKKKETMDLHIFTRRFTDYMVLFRHVHLSLSKEKNGNLKKRETMDLHILTTRLSDNMVLLRHVHLFEQRKEWEFEKEINYGFTYSYNKIK